MKLFYCKTVYCIVVRLTVLTHPCSTKLTLSIDRSIDRSFNSISRSSFRNDDPIPVEARNWRRRRDSIHVRMFILLRKSTMGGTRALQLPGRDNSTEKHCFVLHNIENNHRVAFPFLEALRKNQNFCCHVFLFSPDNHSK